MIPIILLMVIIGVFVIRQFNTRKRLPPGPFPFLFLGNIPQLAYGAIRYGGLVNTMKHFARKYGNTHTVWIGPTPTVNICDYETSIEVMVTQGANHSRRWTPNVFGQQRTDKDGRIRGTIWSQDEIWSEHRRFSLRTLRNFGLGRNVMERTIMEEFEYHCDVLDKEMSDGVVSVVPGEMFDMLIGSIINRMLFGYRFDEKNKEKFFSVKRKLDHFFEELNAIDFALGPWCRRIPLIGTRYKHLLETQEDGYALIRENIERRKKELASGERQLDGEGDDFMDAYFIEKSKRDREGKPHVFDEFGLSIDLFDLWIAGQETTSITLCWGFIYLLLHPEVKENCRNEIISVTKKNRNVSLTDRATTPYLNATIMEIQRLASIMNMNISRRNKTETQCGEFVIPPDTIIASQISLVMLDEGVFKEPYRFNPDRFLDGDRTVEQCVIPFGIGKRSCLGESLARAELYLVLSNMLHRYEFSVDEEHPPSMTSPTENEMMHRPPHFKMNVHMC